MSGIATPAFRLTADCIWNSFRSSKKRHLILTGKRGAGKTTLLSRLFPELLPGITTWAQPRKAVYLKENTSGRSVMVGIYDETLPGSENKMVLRSDEFVSFGVPALRRCMASGSDWISIDEIGYLEAQCEPYHKALCELMEQKHLAAVVRKQDVPFLRDLCQRADVFLVDLDHPFGDIGCVIMASGLGKRFGGNKLMADFRGEPLICRVLNATQGVFSRRVVVTRHEAVAALCAQRKVSVVLHDQPGRNDTVRLGLEHIDGMERCMFCSADQPLLRRETVASLALAAANDPYSVWRAEYEGAAGMPVVFPESLFPELMALPQGKGGGVVIKKYPERLRMVSARDRYELMDVDTPEDLAFLVER